MSNQSVEIGVSRSFNIKISATDVVNRLVIDHERAIRMLQGGVSGKDRVVGLYYRCGYQRGGVNGKFQLGFLAIVNREALHKQRRKARTCSSAKRVEDKKALKTGALVGLRMQNKWRKYFLNNGALSSRFLASTKQRGIREFTEDSYGYPRHSLRFA